MISPKKLIKLARKWRKTAATRRKRISLPSDNTEVHLAEKGHFVIYTIDHRRYVLPLTYLNNSIFLGLLRLSEEEFGLTSDGPITLPCDEIFMEYIVSLIDRGLAKGPEKSLLNSVTSTSRCSLSASLIKDIKNNI